MFWDIKGKIAVITGGAGGIGLAIAREFLQHEVSTAILLDINENQGAAAVKKLDDEFGYNKSVFIKCDVTTDLEETFKAIADRHGAVDVLVNCAGIVNEKILRKAIEVNVTALIEWSLKYVDHMRTDRGGKGGIIINISSVVGFRVDPYLPVYKATKFAVMGFTKTRGHSCNFDKTGVRLVAICPGATRSTLGEGNWECEDKKEAVEFFNNLPQQDCEAVGKAAAEVFHNARSGTAWLIEGGGPVTEV